MQSVVTEKTAINQQLQDFFPNEQLRLYQTTTPFPVEWLTLQEQAFFKTLKHPNRQASWLLGRTLLKFLACQQSDLLPQDVENPLDTLEAWQFPHSRCSVSHTEQVAYALVKLNQQSASSISSIGLDVEEMSRKGLSTRALGYLLSEAERVDFEQLQLKNPETRLDLRYWTAKEALYKATPAEHQGDIRFNQWEWLAFGAKAKAVTRSGVVLQGQVFNTVDNTQENRCCLSVAMVEPTNHNAPPTILK